MKLEISDISNLGHGVAFDEKGSKIFVPKSVTGDVVEAQITYKNSKFTSAQITNLITASKLRKKAQCQYFDECGGCSLQHLQDDFYKQFKRENIINPLKRSEIEFDEAFELIEVGAQSRRRVNFHVKDNKLGFFKENSRDLVQIDHCLMLVKALADLIPTLQKLLEELPLSLVKQISACEFDNVVDMVFEVEKELDISVSELLTSFAKQAGNINLSYRFKGKIYPLYIKTNPKLDLGNIKIDVPSAIFMQATKKGQQAITAQIVEFVQSKNIKSLIDIYCGVGTYCFSLSSLKSVNRIVAAEGSKAMVESIEKNIKAHNLSDKMSVKNRDLAANPLQGDDLKRYDLAIVNPPRNGAKTQISKLSDSDVKNIIIVSCSLNSLIADAKILLKKGFKLQKITAIDQFYYTSHIELVALFSKL